MNSFGVLLYNKNKNCGTSNVNNRKKSKGYLLEAINPLTDLPQKDYQIDHQAWTNLFR